MGRSARQSAQALATLAHEQGGYFTAKQAQTAGYGYRHLDYHETAGNFERVEHGLYRLPTVPPKFRKPAPRGVVLHEATLDDEEIEERVGDRATSPLRTLLDVAASGVSSEQVAKAINGALAQGMVTLRSLKAALKKYPQGERIEAALRRMNQ